MPITHRPQHAVGAPAAPVASFVTHLDNPLHLLRQQRVLVIQLAVSRHLRLQRLKARAQVTRFLEDRLGAERGSAVAVGRHGGPAVRGVPPP